MISAPLADRYDSGEAIGIGQSQQRHICVTIRLERDFFPAARLVQERTIWPDFWNAPEC
jgi:hypothetical protein